MPSNQLCCDQMLSDRTTKNRPDGFSLVECLVAVALLGILATGHPQLQCSTAAIGTGQWPAPLAVGLDRGRMATEQDRQPCALQLSATGWQPPLAGDLAACREV